MMKKIMIFSVPLILVFLVGCATIIDGDDQDITVTSEPSGATVSINGMVKGVTPMTFSLEKSRNQTITVELDGYREYHNKLDADLNPMFFGNIITGGIPGSITDAVTGAMWEYEPGHYYVKLVSKEGGVQKADSRVNLKTLIVLEADKIREQLARRHVGSELGSLLDGLEIPYSDFDTSIKILHRLSQNHPDDVEFANSILSYYEK